jgi:hypothetical protein
MVTLAHQEQSDYIIEKNALFMDGSVGPYQQGSPLATRVVAVPNQYANRGVGTAIDNGWAKKSSKFRLRKLTSGGPWSPSLTATAIQHGGRQSRAEAREDSFSESSKPTAGRTIALA